MNNLKKIGLSALAGSMAMITAAQSVEYAVSGDAQITFATAEGNENGTESSNGKGIGSDTDLYFTASGELDNGYTIKFFQAFDTADAVAQSSSQVTLGMGSLGSIQYNVDSGSAANGIDDVLPKAFEEVWDSTTHDSKFHGFGSNVDDGSIQYVTPAIEYSGTTLTASAQYDSSAGQDTAGAKGVATQSGSGTAFTVKMAHESGLTIGGGIEDAEKSEMTGDGVGGATGYVLFSSGPISVGYQESYYDAAHANGTEGADTEAEGYSIAYTMGNASISYANVNETKQAVSDAAAGLEVEMSAIQASYTMGAMTLAASMYETDNPEGVAGTYEATVLSASFAF